MTRSEKAQYLTNLHTLMQAQTQTSPWLVFEYDKVWTELKDELKTEQEKTK